MQRTVGNDQQPPGVQVRVQWCDQQRVQPVKRGAHTVQQASGVAHGMVAADLDVPQLKAQVGQGGIDVGIGAKMAHEVHVAGGHHKGHPFLPGAKVDDSLLGGRQRLLQCVQRGRLRFR